MERIGKYTIVGQIGTGGFGVVYEGRDPFLKRRVAIKTCTSEEPEIRDRFFREAEIAGNLQHRNIVTVHDFGVQDEIPYLVQEYLDGEDLDRVVARREPISPLRRVEILAQVARGLEYAHGRGVIHRDVKPGNIRLTSEGTVKIMDFGIAKLSNVASHLTRTGMTIGTAAYLPPEQIRGTPVDHRADLFSFGVTAYELLTYRRPFSGKNISALFWELLQREPDPLSGDWPGCPPALESLVLRCLAKDPGGRYPSFGALLAELEPIIESMQRAAKEKETLPTAPHPAPVRTPPPTAPTPPRPGRSRPAAETPAAPRPALVAAPPGTGPPRGRTVAPPRAADAAALLQPRETAGLLGDVQEALAGARAEAGARRVHELLARGDVEGAEGALASAGSSGEERDLLRREVDRARSDRVLVQAVARWEQGEPRPALGLLDDLLAGNPGHADARRLRESWQEELAQRERQRAASAGESETRRLAVASAVARVEERLGTGDVDAAEAALAAALAELGSHQPLRDLRRRIGEVRQRRPPGTTSAVRRLSDASTLGVAREALRAARDRAAAMTSRRPRMDEAPGVGSWRAPSFAAPAALAGRQRLLLRLGAALLVLLLIAAVIWFRGRGEETAPPAGAPSPPAAPAAGPTPHVGGAVGGRADRP
jgi:serine/threonine-protein kinase